MSQTVELRQVYPVRSVREPIEAGMKAEWARAPDGEPVTGNELAKWIEKLESLAKLLPGWNRQGAPAPSEAAIRVARHFIEALVNDGQPPTRVAASAVGGVGVTRQAGERMTYVEFYNDGTACALLTDDAADERLLDVSPDPATFTDLLNKMKAYLDA